MRISAKTFDVSRGTCTVYRDRIEIHQSNLAGSLGKWLYKRNIYTAAPAYLMLALMLFLAALIGLAIQNYFLLAFLLITGLLAIALFFQNRNQSFVPLIKREQIKEIVYQPAIPGKSRPLFAVSFHPNPEGKPEKTLLRQIVLPNTVIKGTSVADTAYWILKDEGLVRDRQE